MAMRSGPNYFFIKPLAKSLGYPRPYNYWQMPVLSATPHINGVMQAYYALSTSPSLIVL